MKVSRLKLAQLIAARLQKDSSARRVSKEVAAYLLAEGRVNELEPLMRDVIQQRSEAGLIEAVGVSAHPLSPADRQELSRLVKRYQPLAKTVIIDEQIDPSLLGGIRLELANQQLDLTVRAKLNRLRQLTVAKVKG